MGNRRRVAITGLGAITPIGKTVDQFWQGLIEGKSGAGRITQFDSEQFGCKIACEIHGFDPKAHLDHKVARTTERFVQFAIVVAREALA
ncbi:beta-ketoacyl-[acyl-carrier-protein] synthase II, partial [Candidatus Sumerlaeota bacterium]|nr:beta-ketoacyl-[acyl-carrier-protein] synthase II [Candidatus Sumerlaeota bacterium]